MSSEPVVGVLALQGDVRERGVLSARAGARVRSVRTPADLDRLDGVVLPGGESTTMSWLLTAFGSMESLRDRIASGLPVLGTCAGLVLPTERVVDDADGTPDADDADDADTEDTESPDGPRRIAALDVVVRRNAFGSSGGLVRDRTARRRGRGRPRTGGVRPGSLGRGGGRRRRHPRHDGTVGRPGRPRGAADRIVAVRQGRVLATAFHPESTDDERVHRLFVSTVSEVA